MSEIASLVEGAAAGRRRALARLLTLVEDGSPAGLRDAVTRLYPRTGRARIVGITGAPGVGKSVLANALAVELRRRDRTVAVVAVDPSSPFSGGALLGDRVRMQGHHADEGVFIRSMAARGHLGGIAVATPQAVMVLDAAGFDDVLIETVGVGQSEVAVASTADTTVVCVAPDMGDAVQAAKAGILEVGDVFVVNKADRDGAGRTVSQLRSMLELGAGTAHPRQRSDAQPAGPGQQAWQPPIVRTVAIRPEGVGELADALAAHHRHAGADGTLLDRRRDRARHIVREIALTRLRERLGLVDGTQDGLLEELADKVANRDLDPYTAADQLVEVVDR